MDSPMYGECIVVCERFGKACRCGDDALIWTSWSDDNPSRRFCGCPNDEVQKRKVLANYLRKKIRNLEAQSRKENCSSMAVEDKVKKSENMVKNLKEKCAKLKEQSAKFGVENIKRREREKWYIVIITMLVLIFALPVVFP